MYADEFVSSELRLGDSVAASNNCPPPLMEDTEIRCMACWASSCPSLLPKRSHSWDLRVATTPRASEHAPPIVENPKMRKDMFAWRQDRHHQNPTSSGFHSEWAHSELNWSPQDNPSGLVQRTAQPAPQQRERPQDQRHHWLQKTPGSVPPQRQSRKCRPWSASALSPL